MATSPKTAVNPLHRELPHMFKRTGEVRRVKGFRSSRENFNMAVRMGRVLKNSGFKNLTVISAMGSLTLSEEHTALIQVDDVITELIMSGYRVEPPPHVCIAAEIIDFRVERRFDTLTQLALPESEE